ncbi:MAG: hypothetical protein WAU01_10385, partial [Saprospiraceae bacterium]
DQDGMGDMDDKSSIVCSKDEKHEVMVMDQNGCWIQQKLSFNEGNTVSFEPKDGKILADEEMGDGKFKFNLLKALDPLYGDIDGDHLLGSVFNVKFLKEGQVIENPAEYVSEDNQLLTTEFETVNGVEKSSTLFLTTGFFFLRNNSSTACDYFDPILIEATTLDGDPLPAGGTFKAFERSTLVDYTSQVLAFNPGNSTWTWDPMFKPPIPVSPLRYILYYIVGTDTLQSQLNVVSPSGSVDVLVSAECGNDGLVQVLCSPADGILTGQGLTSSTVTFVNSDQIIYFIDTKLLTPNFTYTFTYSIPQATGTGQGLRCAAVISDSLRMLPFPSIDINQYDSQVCESEAIILNTTAIPSPDNSPTVLYQWYLRSNGITTPIPNANSAQLSLDDATTSGQYIVKVTQSNGCMAQDTAQVEVIIFPNVTSEVLSDATCFGVNSGEADILIEGVTDYTGYAFSWLGKSTGVMRTGRVQTQLPADSFLVRVTTPVLNTSGLMCSILDTLVIYSHPSIGIECGPQDTTVSCFGHMDMARTITVSPGAIGPFGYSIDNIAGPYQTSNTFTGLGVGTDINILSRAFKVYVRDGNGCID